MVHINKSSKNIFQLHTAFSLAEVLITLGIIGIVAAMTIPNLISQYEKNNYVTRLAKAYSSLNGAIDSLKAEYGCSDLACTGIYNNNGVSNDAAHQKAGSAIVKKFNIAKDCGILGAGCFPAPAAHRFDGTNLTHFYDSNGHSYKFVTQDGFMYKIFSTGDNCLTNCGNVILDVNGFKKPNAIGRDIFSFYIYNDKIYPAGGGGTWNTTTHWGCTAAANGSSRNNDNPFCTGRVIEEGWQMNY